MKAPKSSIFLSRITRKLFGRKINYYLRYMHQRGHWPCLTNPKDASEYLISKMFNPSVCQNLSRFVDKVIVRDYIIEKGLRNILLKHYCVWDSPEEINVSDLPEHFILKSNNGCANHVICNNKSTFDIASAMATLNHAMLSGQKHVEPHYHYIQPKVFAEELIETPNGEMPIDYKFTCIHGEIVDVFVATDRTINTKYCTLDLEWNILPYTKSEFLPKVIPPKPKNLDKLIEVAKVLSSDFDFVRVDLYEYKDQPFFSELTFFPWGGLLYSYTDEAIKLYGDKINAKKH